MKKTAAVFMLVLVCMLSCMFPLRYGLKQAAKAVMHHRMLHGREEAFVLIPASDLQAAEWEHDREFRLRGQMYDVEGVEYHNGLKYYRCVADGLETSLERRADDVAAAATGQRLPDARRSMAQALTDWLHSLYCEAMPQLDTCPPLLAANAFFTPDTPVACGPYLLRMLIPPEVRATAS